MNIKLIGYGVFYTKNFMIIRSYKNEMCWYCSTWNKNTYY